MGIQGIHGYTWVYRVYMGIQGIQGIQGIHGYTGYTGYTNINHEGLHWTANEYAENVGSVKTCLWLQTRYVLSSFGVLLMSCRVKFHVVRSALQYSACRIICIPGIPGYTWIYRVYRVYRVINSLLLLHEGCIYLA